MTLTSKAPWILGGIIALAGILTLAAAIAHANPSFFPSKSMTATATSTLTFMPIGTATTTLVYDAYGINGTNQSSPSDPTATPSATLAVQFTASSTASVLGIAIERSDDGIDWYQDNLLALGTTGAATTLATPNTFAWTFASSTMNGVATTNNNRIGKVINIPTPTRYTRAVLTMSGTNGAVWAAFIPTKQAK